LSLVSFSRLSASIQDEDEETGSRSHHRHARRPHQVDEQVNILFLLFGLPSLKSLHIGLHRLAPLLHVLRNWKGQQQHPKGGKQSSSSSFFATRGGLDDDDGEEPLGLDADLNFYRSGLGSSAHQQQYHLRSSLERIR
jgi:hypothetical protein